MATVGFDSVVTASLTFSLLDDFCDELLLLTSLPVSLTSTDPVPVDRTGIFKVSLGR